jgi:hypothetical protein
VSGLSIQCGILDVSQPYRPARPATGIALLHLSEVAIPFMNTNSAFDSLGIGMPSLCVGTNPFETARGWKGGCGEICVRVEQNHIRLLSYRRSQFVSTTQNNFRLTFPIAPQAICLSLIKVKLYLEGERGGGWIGLLIQGRFCACVQTVWFLRRGNGRRG